MGPSLRRAGTLLVLLSACPGAEAAVPQTARVVIQGQAPTIDGRLDDAVWADADLISHFLQVSPVAGAAPSVLTEVRLLHDGKSLFVGIRVQEPPHAKPTARQTRRDAELYGDDHISLVFDPAGGGRNGYVFRVNANGAQQDALIYDGAIERNDWDAIWNARVTPTADGWTAELAIPLNAFSGAGAGPWGFNLERYRAASGERLRWQGVLPDREVASLRDAGRLLDMPTVAAGQGLRVKPSLRLAQRRQPDERDTLLEPSLDVFWRVRPDTTATLTLNTDFAESEVDERQVNLTRFNLFFPEKREFFLQDAGVFAFGGLRQDALPFFSRRIGLADDGQPLSLDAGLKLTHESRMLEAGLLATRVEASARGEATTVGVGRMAARVSEHGRLGAIGTVGNPSGSDGSHLWGLDYQYRNPRFFADRALALNVWTQASCNFDTGQGSAQGLSINWPNLGWTGNVAVQRIDTDYAPALGFVLETGIDQVEGELGHWWRTTEGGSVIPQFDWLWKQGQHDDRLYYFINPEIYLENARGDYVLPELYAERERLIQDFEILPGLVIPAGDYRYESVALFAGIGAQSALSGEGSLRFGDFYDGRREDYALEAALRPYASWGLTLRGERTDLHLPAGNARVHLAALGLELTPSPWLSASTLAQWDDVSNEVGLNLRLRWTLKPGRDLFLSINRLFQQDDGLRTQAREEIVKLSWNWHW